VASLLKRIRVIFAKLNKKLAEFSLVILRHARQVHGSMIILPLLDPDRSNAKDRRQWMILRRMPLPCLFPFVRVRNDISLPLSFSLSLSLSLSLFLSVNYDIIDDDRISEY